jgi:alpha-glucosidase
LRQIKPHYDEEHYFMSERIWWKHGVIYQIYPRSFYDSNGDGIGDLPGIIKKLDYCAELGVDAIWLSPVNTSPMHDFGYDICDYRAIDPVFGTMDDFDFLLNEAHARGIKIIMDLVLNHTSYLHPWFIESSGSRVNPKRDWYIWHSGKRGHPPNNWRSSFGGSAWEWHGATGQFYLHSFLKEQPDLNWRNPSVMEAVFADIRFWLDKGVDGFRLDAVNYLIKNSQFRNNPFAINPFDSRIERFNRNRFGTHDILRSLRTMMDEYHDRVLIGEVFCYPPGSPSLSASFLGRGDDELNLAFDFSLMYRFWNARRFYRCIKHWYGHIPVNGWPCNVLSNHDQPRNINRYFTGDEDKRARVAAMLLLTMKGTPFIYYGEEIGMKNFRIPRKLIRDPAGKKFWPFYSGRDCARTPMQWTAGKNAGFSSGQGWLPVGMDYQAVNVEKQSDDIYSLLSFYRILVKLRRAHPSLERGEFKTLITGYRGVLAYLREYNKETVCIALNFKKSERHMRVHYRGQWKVLLSTHKAKNKYFTDLHFVLMPYEATVLRLMGGLN